MKKKYIVLIFLGIIGVWGGSGWAINTWINASYRGTFGDMFGVVNALFSGLAFAGLIYTILIQKDELALQRKAIDDQVKETARSADQLELQKQLLNYQLTLATVNDLIKLKNQRLQDLDILINNSTSKGREVLLKIIKHHTLKLKELLPDAGFKELGHYAETYFFIIEFIESADIQEREKNKLKQIIKVHTSPEELEVLNKIASEGSKREKLLLLQRLYNH